MPKHEPKTYEAELWVLDNEKITFAVNFSGGSHLKISWHFKDEDPCLATNGDPCIFPSRFGGNGKLYYGCHETVFACAIKVDNNYEQQKGKKCEESCWSQSTYNFQLFFIMVCTNIIF